VKLLSIADVAIELGLDASNLREMFTSRKQPLPFYQHPETKAIYIEERIFAMLQAAIDLNLSLFPPPVTLRRIRAYMVDQPTWTNEQLTQMRPPVKKGDRFMHPPLPWPQRSDIPEGSLFTEEDWE
jgi:hypothetical protein